MAFVPLYCANCETVSEGFGGIEIRDALRVTVADSRMPCPRCGEMASFLEGVYDERGKGLEIVDAPMATLEILAKLKLTMLNDKSAKFTNPIADPSIPSRKMPNTTALMGFAFEVIKSYGIQMELEASIIDFHKNLKISSAKAIDGDRTIMFFGRGDPNTPEHRSQYLQSYAELIKSSELDGRNIKHTRRLAVAYIYALWENNHREMIANEIGIDPNKLLSPIMGDLRHLRNAIMHAGGRLDRNLAAINAFKLNQAIEFTSDTFHLLFSEILNGLSLISKEYYNSEINFSLDFKVT